MGVCRSGHGTCGHLCRRKAGRRWPKADKGLVPHRGEKQGQRVRGHLSALLRETHQASRPPFPRPPVGTPSRDEPPGKFLPRWGSLGPGVGTERPPSVRALPRGLHAWGAWGTIGRRSLCHRRLRQLEGALQTHTGAVAREGAQPRSPHYHHHHHHHQNHHHHHHPGLEAWTAGAAYRPGSFLFAAPAPAPREAPGLLLEGGPEGPSLSLCGRPGPTALLGPARPRWAPVSCTMCPVLSCVPCPPVLSRAGGCSPQPP